MVSIPPHNLRQLLLYSGLPYYCFCILLHVQGVVLHHRATLRLQRETTKDTLRVRHEGMKRTSRLYVVCCVDLGDISCSALP